MDAARDAYGYSGRKSSSVRSALFKFYFLREFFRNCVAATVHASEALA